MNIHIYYKDHSGCNVQSGMEVGKDKIKTGGRDEKVLRTLR